MGQGLLWKNSLQRDRNNRNLPRIERVMTLFVIEGRIGEIHNIFMAVDVGHGGRMTKRNQRKSIDNKTMETIKAKPQDYIYQEPVFNQVAYL